MKMEDLILKAKEAKSAEELLALAKENEIEMNEESAKAYFEQLHKKGELSDEEIDNVAGGGCYHDGKLVVTVGTNACEHFMCERCGNRKTESVLGPISSHFDPYTTALHIENCGNCIWCKYIDALWLCTYKNR